MTPTQTQAPNPVDQLRQQQTQDRQKLVLTHGETIKKLLSDHVDTETQYEKFYQYTRLQRADFYYRGIQWIAPQINGDSGYVTYAPINGQQQSDMQTRRGLLDYNLNIVSTYGKKFAATLGQRPFYNMRAVPDDPQNEADRLAAREANKGYLILRSWWDVKIKNSELADLAYRCGTTFPFVRWVADANKYGTTEEPIISTQKQQIAAGGYKCHNCGAMSPELKAIELPSEDGTIDGTVCPSCNLPLDQSAYQPPIEVDVPVQAGVQKYPNGRVELHLLTGFFITTPFYVTAQKDAPFFDWTAEEHVGTLLAAYPELRAKMRGGSLNVEGGGTSTEQYGALARASSTSQVGTARQQSKDLAGHHRTWLRPWMFEMVEDDTKREALKRDFPDGVLCVRVGKELVNLVNENLDDYFNTMQPELGNYIFRDGVCWGILQHQDALNDIFNQLVEIVERTNTVTIVHPDLIDVDAWSDRPNLPAEIIAAAPSAGSNFEGMVKTLQSPRFPAEAPQLIDMVKSHVESNTGVLPNVFGGGAPTQTAEQHRNELNQALMQLGVTGEFMIRSWEQTFTNGVKELARNAPKNLQVSGTSSPMAGETIDFEVLQSGKWHFEGETGIPCSAAERRDALKDFINSQGPIAQSIAQMLGITQPENIGALQDLLDLPLDLKSPNEEVRLAIQEIIDELSRAQPIEQPPSPMDGSPQPPMPSAPIDWNIYDPTMFQELARFWCSTNRKLQNTPGYQNVLAAIASARQAMQPPMPPPGTNGAPPPPQGGAPQDGPQGAPPPGPPPAVNSKETPQGSAIPSSGAGGPMGQ